ncbi:hypothetical protein Esti_006042 [Eimeria stiedai]
MAAALADDCEADQKESEGFRSLNIAETGNTSAAHSPPPLAGSNEEEDDYEQAALAAAEELRVFNELQEASADGNGAAVDGSGGFFEEDSSHSRGNELNGQEDVAANEPKEVSTDLIRLDGQEQPNGECGTHAEHAISDQLSAVTPSDRELAKLLDDECPQPSSFNPLTGRSGYVKTVNFHQSAFQSDAAIGSSLLDGTAGLAARRRAAEAASWCSQHQAADLYCLREQLLKEEAAAGRLRVRQHPNPHGEAFKPMRLYAIKEVEELANTLRQLMNHDQATKLLESGKFVSF